MAREPRAASKPDPSTDAVVLMKLRRDKPNLRIFIQRKNVGIGDPVSLRCFAA